MRINNPNGFVFDSPFNSLIIMGDYLRGKRFYSMDEVIAFLDSKGYYRKDEISTDKLKRIEHYLETGQLQII